MADELVGVAQAVVVEYPELVQHDRVVHRAAQAEVALAHVLQIAHEPERAGAADFLDVGGGRELEFGPRFRGRNGRVVEVDREPDAEAVVRLEPGDLVAVADLDRALDADEALGRCLFGDAGGLQQEHERTGGAVHDRHFRRGQVDIAVVDTQTGQRRQQMFDRHDLARTAAQAGAQHGLGHQFGARRDLHHRVEVDAAEHDAGIHRGRAQGEKDLLAAVQAHAGGADHVLEGALAQHGLGDKPCWYRRWTGRTRSASATPSAGKITTQLAES